jgi:mono/diheme cytochrome c family protein
MKKMSKREQADSALCLLTALGLMLVLPARALGGGEAAPPDEGARAFREIAGIGCASCHGQFAEGDVGIGPYIRGASEGTIRAAIDAVVEMTVVKAVIEEEEIQAVAEYIRRMGDVQVARTMLKRSVFFPETIQVRPGTPVQVVINNVGFSAALFVSEDMAIDNFEVGKRSVDAFSWQAPDEVGEFRLFCSSCKVKDQYFTIIVDAEAPQLKTPFSPAQ